MFDLKNKQINPCYLVAKGHQPSTGAGNLGCVVTRISSIYIFLISPQGPPALCRSWKEGHVATQISSITNNRFKIKVVQLFITV